MENLTPEERLKAYHEHAAKKFAAVKAEQERSKQFEKDVEKKAAEIIKTNYEAEVAVEAMRSLTTPAAE